MNLEERFGPAPPPMPPGMVHAMTALVCLAILLVIQPPFVKRGEWCDPVMLAITVALCAGAVHTLENMCVYSIP